MMKIYRTQDKQLTRATDFTEGVWVCMTAPTLSSGTSMTSRSTG